MGSLGGGAAVLAPSVSLSPSAGPPKSSVTVGGAGFGARESVRIDFDGQQLGTSTTSASGAFSAAIEVPKSALPGVHTVAATGQTSGLSTQAPFTVRTDWTRFRFDANRRGFQPFEN